MDVVRGTQYTVSGYNVKVDTPTAQGQEVRCVLLVCACCQAIVCPLEDRVASPKCSEGGAPAREGIQVQGVWDELLWEWPVF